MKWSTVENNKTCSLCKLFVYLKRKIVSDLTKLVTMYCAQGLMYRSLLCQTECLIVILIKFRQFNSASRSVINHNNSLCILNKEVLLFENNTLNTFIDNTNGFFYSKYYINRVK